MSQTPKNETAASGMILEIQRMSTDDGPGLRTTVFFKGCRLRCTWCHNPESIHAHPEIQWVGSRCIGCRTCMDVCPEDALSVADDGMHINRDRCTRCGLCTDECPATAMEILGTPWNLDALVHEVLKDRVYFQKSGGGVTASGGEPTLQAGFAAAFFQRLRSEGIATALDTSGFCSRQQLDRILPHTDMVLFDIKAIDPEKHAAFTGSGNHRILDNLEHLSGHMKAHGFPKRLWIRTPVIPGITDEAANIDGIGRWISAHVHDGLERWELCAFNHLCRDKYRRLGLDWPLSGAELLEKAHMERLALTARASGVDPDLVVWSGSTKIDSAADS